MPIFSFFGSTLGKIVTLVIVALTVSGLVIFLYKDHDRLVKAEALAHYNQVQLEQAAKDKDELIHKLEDLQKIAGDLSKQLNDTNQKIDDTATSVDKIIAGHKADDRPSSDVIKDTLKELLK